VRRRRSRISNAGAGAIAAVVIFVACYLVFGGSLPFSSSPFVLKATFTTQTQLHIPSPVRIAGVDVGEVVGVTRVSNSSDAAVVTMDIDPNGLPIHADATVKVRPRIFLEGNYYVDLRPGSPSAPILSSGSTLPAPNTSGPVQLDRVLSALNSDARGNLQTLLQGIGSALDGQPTAAQDASQDPITRGLTGGQALNLSLKYSVGAFRASTIVNEALLGIQPHDLSRVVLGNERLLRGLAASGGSLASLVTTFNATMATLASRQQELSQTIALLPPLLRVTQTSDSALDASFAPTKALLSAADELARCLSHNVIPAGNEVISDPPVGTGLQVYQELFQSAVGIAGASQNFDGNGRYTRASAGGGSIQVQTATLPGGNGALYGNAVLQPLGTRPAWPGKAPPLRRDVACFTQSVPNLNTVRTGVGP